MVKQTTLSMVEQTVYTNMYSTWAFYLSKPPCSICCNKIIKSMHGGSQWLCHITKLDCKTATNFFFLLRMSVNLNTCEKRQHLKFVYTLNHIMVKHTTLSVVQSQYEQAVYTNVYSTWALRASHHAPYVIVINAWIRCCNWLCHITEIGCIRLVFFFVTIHRIAIMVSQTTLPVLEASVCVTQQTVCIPICTIPKHSI